MVTFSKTRLFNQKEVKFFFLYSKAHTDEIRLSLFFSFMFPSALLHTSVSLPACEGLSWKCKLSSQHALALAVLFWFFCPPSSPTCFLNVYLPSPFLPFNFPLHSALDSFFLYHKHHLICFGKHSVHKRKALIDLYNVITPFWNVS